jgi:NAD(P)-dependent dehydrogenase (short-subunit alcohol dehydrogenase family)
LTPARLAGRVGLVTGAGRGIGRAIAVAFAREGADVALAARSAAELGAVADEVKAVGRRAVAVPTDIRDEAAVDALARQATEAFGRVDLLVNAAGVASFGPLAESPLAAWDETMAVNLRGAYLCCRAVLPGMMARRRGTIVNIGSMVTTRTLAGTTAYTAAKYGLLGLSRVLAEEMRSHGVRVGVISAGAVDTPLWDAIPSPPSRELMLRPEQVAEAAVLMASLAANATLEEVTLLPAGGVL